MKWGGRYLWRLLRRVPVRSVLSILLAALLAFAFGLLTVLRGVYAEAYQNVDVRAVFFGGLPYSTAQKLESCGMLKDPGYEYADLNCLVEDHGTTLYFISDLSRCAAGEVEWLDGWDEDAFNASAEAVCVMSAGTAGAKGFCLGDSIQVEEKDFRSKVEQEIGGFFTMEDHEKYLTIRAERRPKLKIVGLLRSESADNTEYIPITAWSHFRWLSSQLILDVATYSLLDYHQSEAFTAYAKDVLSHVQNLVKLELDTSYADRIYRIYRLLETLYPLTIAAALLLGSVLPGLTVLHSSKEISILRALGVKVRGCVGVYVLTQMLCALFGLLLGMALMFLVRRPEPETVLRPCARYLAAHLCACGLGSGIFACLSAGKHVLTQLQAKD